MDERRIALLVDGENLSAECAGFLITTAARAGTLGVKRVFGAVTRLGAWTSAPGFRVVHVSPRKNSADIALSLDALELALTRQVDEIFVATSDRDLTLVALRLAELGFPLTGIGEDKAPADFRKACRRFVAVPDKSASADTPPGPDTPTLPVMPAPVTMSQPFDARMRSFLAEEGRAADGWVGFSALGQPRAKAMEISKAAAGIAKSSSWIDWFRAKQQHYELDERGPQSRVRLKAARAG